jgi:hypothetical protein
VSERTIWLGERRLCLITVSGSRDVPVFGRLPKGRVRGGAAVRGARARLFRKGVLIAEDLHVGALMRDKTLMARIEARDTVHELRRCVAATGHGDVREGDRIEVYRRAGAADPWLVPGYQAVPAGRRLGRAEVRELGGDPLVGPSAVVGPPEGALRAGDRIRVLRDRQPVAEALRLLFVTDAAGRAVDELPADGGALYLGFPDLRPGDAVEAYDVPDPVWTEARTPLLSVHQMRSDGVVAHAMVTLLRKYQRSGTGKDGLEVGHRARVLRDRTVIADGLTIGYLPREKAFDNMLRTGPGNAPSTSFELGIDFPDLRDRDWIEPYQVVPASQSREDG